MMNPLFESIILAVGFLILVGLIAWALVHNYTTGGSFDRPGINKYGRPYFDIQTSEVDQDEASDPSERKE